MRRLTILAACAVAALTALAAGPALANGDPRANGDPGAANFLPGVFSGKVQALA